MSAPWALYKGDYARSAYTALAGTSGSFTRSASLRAGGVLTFPLDLVAHPARSGVLVASDDAIADARTDTLLIETAYGGADTGADITREMLDEVASLLSTLNPADSAWWLRLDRNDGSGNAMSFERLVRIVQIPEWQLKGDNPQNIYSPTYELPIGLQVLYPYWIKATPESQSFASVGTSYSSPATLNNTGHTDRVGLKAVVTAKTGSPTKLYIKNDTTGKEIVVTAPSGLAVDDVIDWYCDDPRLWALTTTNAAHFGASAADADCRLQRGNNSLKLKVDAGTVNVTLYWRRERYTP